LVGGDYQGKNAAVQNAQQTFVGKDVVISADATVSGNGGKLVVWSQDATRMYGMLSARGGALGGDGGAIETSGHYLDVAGARVNASAARGRTGSWLLDPYDIEITGVPGSALGDAAAFGGTPLTSGLTSIAADDITISSANVTLQAQHDITFSSAIQNLNSGVSLTAQAGNDIKVNNSLWMTGDITLKANDNSGGYASGMGGVTIANVGGADGAVQTGGHKLTLSGSYVTVNGGIQLGIGDFDARAEAADGYITVGQYGSIHTSYNGSNAPLISFTADNINLNSAAGTIGTTNSDGFASVSFAPYTVSRAITLGAKTAGTLGLSQADFDTVSAGSVVVGHSGAANINSGGALSFNTVNNVLLESGADINLNHALSLGTGRTGVLQASVDGSGTLTLGSGAALSTDTGGGSVQLTADKMSLGGSVASSVIKLDTYTSDKNINLGVSAADSSTVLGLTDTELKTLHGAHLSIGTASGYTGSDVVTGALNLTGSNTGTTDLTLSGGTVSGSSAVTIGALNAIAQTVSLTGANEVGTISGSSSVGDFSFTAAHNVVLGNISGATGIVLAAGGNITQQANAQLNSYNVEQATGHGLSVSTPGSALLDNSSNHISELSAVNIGALSVKSLNDLTVGWRGNGVSQSSGFANGYLQFDSSKVKLASGMQLSGNDIRLYTGKIVLPSDATIVGTGTAPQVFIKSYGNVNVGAGADQIDTFDMNLSDSTLQKIRNADISIASPNGQVNVTGALDLTGQTYYARNLELGAAVGGAASTQVSIAAPIKVAGELALNAPAVNIAATAMGDVVSIGANSLTLGADVTSNTASIAPFDHNYKILVGGTGCSAGSFAGCLEITKLYHMVTPTLGLGDKGEL
ncbi:MAG: hypothetical protein V4641_08605, partial [Pseudomonadota bacterium]